MNAPQQLTVRLGDDFNWWVESADVPLHARGVLDPRQVAHFLEALHEYRAYGFRPALFTAAFHAYRIDAEIPPGVLRLVATDDLRDEIFALPITGDDEEGAYFEFLDALTNASIRKLNAAHHYAHDCNAEEMTEELELIDVDRYFGADTIHAFDEINEILEWSPAEWDEP